MNDAIRRGLEYLAVVETAGERAPAGADAGGARATANVFTATFVHDALDPALYPDPALGSIAERIRQRIHRVVQRHEEPDHTWRFLGRGSRMDPDADTTACGAAVRARYADRSSYIQALRVFEDDRGLFPSYVDARGHRYSWILEGGVVLQGVDRVVQANVARFFGLARQPCPALWAFLDRELALGAFAAGSPDYPNPITFFYMTGRALVAGQHSCSELFITRFVTLLEPLLRGPKAEEAPLTCALTVLAWLYAGGPPGDVRGLVGPLAAAQQADGSWRAEPFFVGGYGSCGLTTALALEALVRAGFSC
jgi:hypothetical protein